ncbi:MAG TPA: GNAT family N-acetyltransferase [Dongiaceae bacterium]|nr:GNAT family N-acetyltransferase [Dongiaceae bacterium]
MENASMRQSPVFNAHFRQRLARPVYLKCEAAGQPVAYVCIIEIGLPGFKCGAVIDGPVACGERAQFEASLPALIIWLQRRGLVFVRFSHKEQSILEGVGRQHHTIEGNPLPFVPRYSGELVVDLAAEDDRLLAGFQQIARQEIRRAREAGCVVQQSSDPEAFRQIWPIFVDRARVKGIRVAGVKEYEGMFRLSPRPDLVRLYTAYYQGQAVYAAVFLREKNMVHYFLGALDATALGKQSTPSCLVHWQAMRDYRQLGCRWYNLGARSGPVYAFKKKFRPQELPSAGACTLVFGSVRFWLWTGIFLRVYEGGQKLLRLVRRTGG